MVIGLPRRIPNDSSHRWDTIFRKRYKSVCLIVLPRSSLENCTPLPPFDHQQTPIAVILSRSLVPDCLYTPNIALITIQPKIATPHPHNAHLKLYHTAQSYITMQPGLPLSRISRNAPLQVSYRYHKTMHTSNRFSVSPPLTTACLMADPDYSAYNVQLVYL